LLPYLRAYLQSVRNPKSDPGVEVISQIDPEVLETYFAATDVSAGIAMLSRYALTNRDLSQMYSTMNPTETFEHLSLADDAQLRVANLSYESGHIDDALKLYETLAVHSAEPLELHEKLVSIYERRSDQLALRKA